MSSPLSVVPASDSESDLSDIEESSTRELSRRTSIASAESTRDGDRDIVSESDSDGLSEGEDEEGDDDDDGSSLSDLSSDDEPATAQSSAAINAPQAPVKRGRGRPRKRKAEEIEGPAQPPPDDLSTRRSLRRHGLPPEHFKNEEEQNPPKRSISESEIKRTRSGAKRSSTSTSKSSLTRTRSGRQPPPPAPALQSHKPIRQRPSSNSIVEVAIGPSNINKSDFSPGGSPDEYATPSPTKRQRIASSGSVIGGEGEGESSPEKKKRRKPKNRGWGRSGTAKTGKSDANPNSPSAPRSHRRRIFRSDPCLDYLNEVFSLNENGGEDFQFNGDDLSVPFPFTFRRGQFGLSSKDAAEGEGNHDAKDESSEMIEMPLEGPQSVLEVSHKVPLQIPAGWIPPLPPQAVRHLERVERRNRRRQQVLGAATTKEETAKAEGEVDANANAVNGERADVKMDESGGEAAPVPPKEAVDGGNAVSMPVGVSEPAVDVSAPKDADSNTSTAVKIENAPIAPEDPEKVVQSSAATSSAPPPDIPAPSNEPEVESDDSDTESDDGISPLRPSSFYPTPGGSGGFPGIPIFTPTMSQFRDFYSMCKRIDAWGMRTGIVKIIPPKEWTDALPNLNTEVVIEEEAEDGGHEAGGKEEVTTLEGAAQTGTSAQQTDAQPETVPAVQAAVVPESSPKSDAPEGGDVTITKADRSEPASIPTIASSSTAAPAPSSSTPTPPLRTIRIRNVIRQLVLAVGSGAYSQTNLTTPNKVWNAKQWAEICASEGQRGPELERMKRKIESLKAGADALHANGLSGYRRKRKDAIAPEDLDEMLKETEGVRTRSGRKHRTARDEEADDEDEVGPEHEIENEDATAEMDDELRFSKQPRASASSAAVVHSPPRSEHGVVEKAENGVAASAHHALTPPASHANDGSDRSDHHAGSPAETGTVLKPEGPNAGETQMDVDPDMPALEEVDGLSQNASPSKPKKVFMPDRTTPAEWQAFDYKTAWLAEALDLDEHDEEDGNRTAAGASSSSSKTLPKPTEWTIDVCKEIEGEYWRNLSMGKPAMYGADLPGTLFEPDMTCWNVGKLDNLLTRMRFRRKLRGVTTPYLYFGMWRATFAWHLEDMDLYSINYIHFGAPKQWYAIPQTERKRFETAMASAFPGDARKCTHFMRHKSYLVSPRYLARHNIKPLKLVQHAGEFVITYPYGYHSGFNLGFNCAESVNFALDTWVEIGRNAGFCKCRSDSVQMDVEAFLNEAFEEDQARAKKEQEEVEKKERARLKRLGASMKGKSKAEDGALGEGSAKISRAKKAKKDAGAEDGLVADGAEVEGDASILKKGNKPKGFPCVFCVSMIEDDMVPIPPTTLDSVSPKVEQGPPQASAAETSSAQGAAVPSDAAADGVVDGEENVVTAPAVKAKLPPAIRYAHRLCANVLPETWVHREVEVVTVRKTIQKEKAAAAVPAVGALPLTGSGPPARGQAASNRAATSAAAAAVHETVPSSDDEDADADGEPVVPEWKQAARPVAVPSSDSGDDDEAPIQVDREAEAVAGSLLYLNGGGSSSADVGGSAVEYEEVEEEVVKEEEVRGFESIERARWALKCSLCPTNQLAKHGCKVQCTRAKCSRAAHVTCANLADSGWLVAILKKDEADTLEFGGQRSKKGSKSGKSKAKAAVIGATTEAANQAAVVSGSSSGAGPADASGAATSTGPDADIDRMEVDAPIGSAGGEAEDEHEPQHEASDADERLVLLCRAHNPEAKKAEAIRRALTLREQCLALRPMSLINVRAGSNSGVWQVLLLEVHDVPGGEVAVRAGMAPTTKGEVVVMYDGQRHRIKWGRIEFGATGKSATAGSSGSGGAGAGAGASASVNSTTVPAAAGPGPSTLSGTGPVATPAPASSVFTGANAQGAPPPYSHHQHPSMPAVTTPSVAPAGGRAPPMATTSTYPGYHHPVHPPAQQHMTQAYAGAASYPYGASGGHHYGMAGPSYAAPPAPAVGMYPPSHHPHPHHQFHQAPPAPQPMRPTSVFSPPAWTPEYEARFGLSRAPAPSSGAVPMQQQQQQPLYQQPRPEYYPHYPPPPPQQQQQQQQQQQYRQEHPYSHSYGHQLHPSQSQPPPPPPPSYR